MRLIKICIITLSLVMTANIGAAQFSISKVTPKQADTKAINDTVKKLATINNQFFSESRYKAEQKRLRHERNTVTIRSGLTLNQTGFSNWAPGGNNTFSGAANFFFQHQYIRNKFNLTYNFDSRYGIQVIDDEPFKNEDWFVSNVNASWSLNKNWAYSASANFRSQYSKGYKSRAEKIMVSDFMAPGTLNVGAGITYKNLKTPLVVTVNPIGGSMTFVLNDSLSKVGAHGVPAGERQISTLASSISITYNKTFAKGILQYITTLYAVSNFDTNTNGYWDNTLNIKITKFLNAPLFCRTVYNKYQETPTGAKLQLNYSIGLGLAYNFSNK